MNKYPLFTSLILIIILSICNNALGQLSYSKYYIELTDKEYSEYNISNPEEFLSERAIQRRSNHNIDIDYRDLPVSQFYLDSLKYYNIEIIHASKWFNLVTAKIYDVSVAESISDLSFVNSVVKISEHESRKKYIKFGKYSKMQNISIKEANRENNYYNYGFSYNQIAVHNGHMLHNDGYRGQGIIIAVTDSGFDQVPNLSSFDSLLYNNRVIFTKDLVSGIDDVYYYHNHGTWVLSVLAGNYPEYLIGSAPEADYMLFITEDVYSETIIEELNWLVAAEIADSAGADIINVSLGYLEFDDPAFNYSYEDMDGETSIISRAAQTAFEKGMIVVAAAGNSGNNQHHPYIVTPGDSKNAITVGAITQEYDIAPFSSIGPTYDGRVKPDVVAIGSQTVIQNTEGNFQNGYGTSFAAPIIAGLTACLWQKHPDKTNYEIIQKIRESSSEFNTPNASFGYGIPDFNVASILLKSNFTQSINNGFDIYPNPFENTVSISIKFDINFSKNFKVLISDITGRMVYKSNFVNSYNDISLDLSSLNKGTYILSIMSNNNIMTQKIIKK